MNQEAIEHRIQEKTNVTAVGFIHEPMNLQAVSPTIELFQSHMENTSGVVIIYFEQAGLTSSDRRLLREKVKQIGLAGITLEQVRKLMGLSTNSRDILLTIDKLDECTGEEIVFNKLLPPPTMQRYFLARGMDLVSKGRVIIAEHEIHDKGVLLKDRSQAKEYNYLGDKAFAAWNHGNFDNSSRNMLASQRLVAQNGVMREHDMRKQMESAILYAFTQQGGSVFSLTGDAHAKHISQPVVDRIQPGRVEFVLHEGSYETSLFGKVQTLLRHGNNVPSLLVPQLIAYMSTFNEFGARYTREGLEWRFMNNYETNAQGFQTAIETLTIEELREACERRTSLLPAVLERFTPVL